MWRLLSSEAGWQKISGSGTCFVSSTVSGTLLLEVFFSRWHMNPGDQKQVEAETL